MTCTQISLQAFELARVELAKSQAKVLWAINYLNQNGEVASDKQIAKLLGWEINRVVPRRNKLEKANRIYGAGVDYDGLSKVRVNIWKIRGAL